MHAFVARKQKAQSQNQRKANMRKRVVYFALKMELLHPAALLDAAAQHRLMPCENTLLAVCVARSCC